MRKSCYGFSTFIVLACVIFIVCSNFNFSYASESEKAREELFRFKPSRENYAVPPYDYPRPEYHVNAGNIARVSILIDGERAKIYERFGNYYVEGREGSKYSLMLISRSNRRVKAVISVDGLDVIDGKTASFNKPGYIISPYSSANIKGWRISDDEVATFRFGPISESYAMKMDKPSDIGAINLAFYRERIEEPPYIYSDMEIHKNESGAPERKEKSRPAATASPSESYGPARLENSQSIGTEFGEKRYSGIRRTEFEARTSYPEVVVKINYASHEDLIKKGVIGGGDIIIYDKVREDKKRDEGNYCRPPEDWRK